MLSIALLLTSSLILAVQGLRTLPLNPSPWIRLESLKRNMFSGIVEDVGTVVNFNACKEIVMWDGSVGEGVELTVKSPLAVSDAQIGCSIAVNGVCLTATTFDHEKFTVGLAPETLRRTNLGFLQPGCPVNIERAMPANGRNSGHFVQGHVDCTAFIMDRWVEEDSLWLKFCVKDDEHFKYIVPKGFVAIDGTSLTVCEVNKGSRYIKQIGNQEITMKEQENASNWFTVMLVPHTQQSVILPLKQKGDLVNIEVDVLGKLVERSMEGKMSAIEARMEQLVDTIEMQEREIKTLKDLIMKLTVKLQMELQ